MSARPSPSAPRPVPAPPRTDSSTRRALTDHAGALAAIGDLALDKRAAALADIHEDLSAALREAED
ncbi:hypothetical protein [uncultured Actinomyces sp.]|uniref:hypothetical protein n=1 Tax=uncultured Actinomyces sp. TaxID=249061 RepID=UPI00288B6B4F|nr:hypothetical protein [uncultured Actinomyces sp.]